MAAFADDLRRFGPDGAESTSLSEALAYTKRLAGEHYENFPVLSVFVPRHLQQHFANIYAYCRWSDDLADEVGCRERAKDLLDWWEGELRRAYTGEARHPVMLALAQTIREFSIPAEPFTDLLVAFRRDQDQSRYPTFAELLDYCRCSANPVGRLVLYLYRSMDSIRVRDSDFLCTGLQLANFWQDVKLDWQKGRVYLPREDLDRFGVSEDNIKTGEVTPAFRKLMAFEVDRAQQYLLSGMKVASGLPLRLRIVLTLFGQGGLGILQAIREVDYDVLACRPKLTRMKMAGVFLRASAAALTMTERSQPGSKPR